MQVEGSDGKTRPEHMLGVVHGMAVALIAPLVAFVIQRALVPSIYSVPFVFFFLAVAITAWFGGPRPGFVAVVLSATLGNYFFLLPIERFTFSTTALLSTLLFAAVASLINLLTASLRERSALLQKRERQLRLITDGLPGFIAYVDRNYRLRFVNATFQRFFDKPLEYFEGRHLRDVLGAAIFDERRPFMEEALRGRATRQEARMVPKNGVRGHMVGEYIPDFSETGEVRGCIVLITDVSAQKKVQDELENAIQVRDEFLSIASHELKTPLTSLQLQINGVQRAAKMGRTEEVTAEKLLARFHAMDRQVARMSGLINNLLDVSRASAGRLQLHLSSVDLAEVVREVAERFKDDIAKARCTLSVALEDDVVGNWDRLRLDQVVTNFVTNCLRYASGKPIFISVGKREGMAWLTVRDEGIGIAPADQARVFERFARAAPSAHYGGLGLGLWIVRILVEAMDGTVSVVSESGVGSTFRVELPLSREADKQQKRQSPEAGVAADQAGLPSGQ